MKTSGSRRNWRRQCFCWILRKLFKFRLYRTLTRELFVHQLTWLEMDEKRNDILNCSIIKLQQTFTRIGLSTQFGDNSTASARAHVHCICQAPFPSHSLSWFFCFPQMTLGGKCTEFLELLSRSFWSVHY